MATSINFKTRILFLLALLSVLAVNSYAQTPTINWQRNYGDVRDDYAGNVINAENGNLILTSIDQRMDATGVYFYYLGVRKTDHFGNLLWSKLYSPMTINNMPAAMDQYQFTPTWIRLDSATGNIAINIYIANSNSVTGPFFDILTLDSGGNYLDNRKFSGSLCQKPSPDITYTVSVTGDPNIASGYSRDSIHLRIWGSDQSFDTLIKHVAIKQQFLFSSDPSTFYQYVPVDVYQFPDKSILLLTQLQTMVLINCSDCNNVQELSTDIIIYKFDSTGNLILSKDISNNTTSIISPALVHATMNNDYLVSWTVWPQGAPFGLTHVIQFDQNLNQFNDAPLNWNYSKVILNNTSNGFYAVGTSDNDSIFPTLHGEADAVAGSFDVDGNTLWKQAFGGSDFEFARDIVATADGGIVFLSDAQSADGDIASPLGGRDAWLVKLGGVVNGITETDTHVLGAYPNPASSNIYVQSSDAIQTIRITDMNGQVIKEANYANVTGTVNVDIRGIAAGSYILETVNKDQYQKSTRIQVMGKD